MGEKKTVEAVVEGGKATAGPPLGPALSPLGVNVLMIVNAINDLTRDYGGMKVPVKVIVDVDTKDFEVEVGTPTASALIIKELKQEKGSGAPGSNFIGDLSMDQVIRIARMKKPDLYAKTLKGAVKTILGACQSMGVKVEGKEAKLVSKDLDQGLYDDRIAED
ncbi:MAG: 50S ribosomal protein L11 [Candidatus Bathyarchaeia archaeon]